MTDHTHFIGPDGVLSFDIDAMVAQAKTAAARIALEAGNRDELARVVAQELARMDMHPAQRAAWVALVVDSLAGDIFAPLLSYVQVRERDYDFLAELRQRAGVGTETGNLPDSKTAEQGGPDDGHTTMDGR
ncbi:hypothetical protein [Agromyces subbeticus]|uniref:hypothetical protein n=1 Tax=Agromyces subbeticus TaxID=293890 RepID=UPI0003B37149|nr:hypothetical protein [Agromyces subbeticus]